MKLAAHSTLGLVRSENQDTAIFYQKLGGEFIAVVCDGMGGHLGGKIASETAANFIIEQYKTAPNFRDRSLDEIKIWFSKTIEVIDRLYAFTIQEDYAYQNMGTTICLAIGVGQKVYIANIGDSRAYTLFGKKLTQITEDHTIAYRLYKEGHITKKEIETHQFRNVLYNVFSYNKEFTADWFEVELVPKSTIILMSDGIYSEVSDSQIVKLVNNANSPQSATVSLCEAANENGGKDNNAVIVGEF